MCVGFLDIVYMVKIVVDGYYGWCGILLGFWFFLCICGYGIYNFWGFFGWEKDIMEK